MSENTPAEIVSFEVALARLEEIAVLLDRNDVPLAEALTLCAEAATLTRLCRTILTDAEGTLERLLEAADGSVCVEPLEVM